MSEQDDQPFVDAWPMFDEALSKIPAPFDIERAREKLARRFNVRPAPLAKLVDALWDLSHPREPKAPAKRTRQ
jgi:hypothetical protein